MHSQTLLEEGEHMAAIGAVDNTSEQPLSASYKYTGRMVAKDIRGTTMPLGVVLTIEGRILG